MESLLAIDYEIYDPSKNFSLNYNTTLLPSKCS